MSITNDTTRKIPAMKITGLKRVLPRKVMIVPIITIVANITHLLEFTHYQRALKWPYLHPAL